MEQLELHVRSEGDSLRTSITAVRPASAGRNPYYDAFPPGIAVGTPLLNRLEFSAASIDGNRDTEAVVTAGILGMSTSLEVVADLAEPIPGRDTRRVYVLSGGTLPATIVCDADTGEQIPFDRVRVVIAVDSVTLAWVA